jgi:uncharacterized BrkB/YihY/UPF0761 family membrane protein
MVNSETVGSVTQAAGIMVCSIFFYMVYLIALGPVVDTFVFSLAGSLDLSPWGEARMMDVIIFGTWWYHLIKLSIIIIVIWFFIFIIKRWRYNRQVDEYDWFEKV